MGSGSGECAWRLVTPRGAGAIAIFQLSGDIEAGLARLGLEAPRVGDAAARDLCGVDFGVAARASEGVALLMPHGGPAIAEALAAAMRERGVAGAGDADSESMYPEAADRFEAMMLEALSRAASSDAVELLLDQPRRWRAWDGAAPSRMEIEERSVELNRLIEPARVVAVGGANVGKSTLVNALARRRVSIVADQPGTTRDHVGVTLDLAGLTVRWIDSPGWRTGAGSIEQAALDLARAETERADLVLLCRDERTELPSEADLGVLPGHATLRVGLRGDLWAGAGMDVVTAAAPGRGGGARGLEALVKAIRERLCPASAMAWEGPWAFDGRLFEAWSEFAGDAGASGGLR